MGGERERGGLGGERERMATVETEREERSGGGRVK
jgi:hypothetical protein